MTIISHFKLLFHKKLNSVFNSNLNCGILLVLTGLNEEVIGVKRFNSDSPEATEKIGEQLADSLSGGEVIAYRGDLGMGKTCFTRGLARGLGYTGEVTSPTFALINEYIGGRLPLYHYDMYRVSGWEDLYSTGFFDYIECGGVIAAEWSENIEGALPENTVYVEFKSLGENSREITVWRKCEQ